MPELLPLFPGKELPAPFAKFKPDTVVPDFAERVRHLRHWQQAIKDRYVHDRKEEVLQAEFLNLIFGQVLGYEYQATTHRQLELELKTLTDGTKPDGALGEFVAKPSGGLGGPVRAVIELKDARTALDAKQRRSTGGRAETPVEQAFSYPSKYGATCRWVMVSNFIELRLYAANDQLRAVVFNLETLPDDEDQLRRFFALLLPQHLLPAPGRAEAPLDEALQQRQQEERKITKEFYEDYKAARHQLLEHLIEQNPDVAPLELLQHTQKLLDRVIFVCFCEDKHIIPYHTFRRLLTNVRENNFDPTDEEKIYRTVKGLFRSIDQGNPAANINRFNGGLFAPDEALDKLTIKDRTLASVIGLETYNFDSQLNVNILGHIFEQSLSDLELERARLSGQAHDPKQGKRKQDGIFYTPEYITRYIVRQAVGGWLQERRREAGLEQLPELDEKDRASIRLDQRSLGRVIKPRDRVQKHIDAWELYKEKLTSIRVLDPACGSGAFLTEAFNFLYKEGQEVNDKLAQLKAGYFSTTDFDRHILQHNLYGVDLNPESVDITRLSLWLQTANPGKPLTSLDHSIRCGNSLISDPAVAGDRAFDWQAAFPEVFEQGGFDVVIGNPPYGASFTESEKGYISSSFKSYRYKFESYIYFIEKAFDLMRPEAYLSYITPELWLRLENSYPIREIIAKHHGFVSISLFGDHVFQDAIVNTVSFLIKKDGNEGRTHTSVYHGEVEWLIETSDWTTSKNFTIDYTLSPLKKEVINRIRSVSKVLGDFGRLTQGITPYDKARGQDADTIKNRAYHFNLQKDETCGKWLDGENINRYSQTWNKEWLSYGSWLGAARDAWFFTGPRLLFREVPGGNKRIQACYVEDTFYHGHSITPFKLSDPDYALSHFLLSIANSKLLSWYSSIMLPNFSKEVFPKLNPQDIKLLPIPNISPAEQQPFITAAEALLSGHKELHEAEAKFGRLVRAELGVTQPLSGKLALTQPWPVWSTALEKARGRKLTLAEKSDWVEYFTEFQSKQEQQRTALRQQDEALDKLVYALYQLTPAEIALVEGKPAPTE
ncbi:Eco57I restriction-modification methylase domain-containing protein [Hymenobacter chitinivorans]|uniref:site-specific DNA-methyltransferase (adenine-specific) n=1 Tax=Hymenobacter chitinivorans DSM 11115 TaxID=1121954 RepID=A0A2M9BQ67_9BACT|nr:DNA methyltransferase [Hymenobacter chitinivorans]PJJ60095.1 N-6 DNA methylase [Hymenobacter chitinivorans DSM 11115]